MNIELKPCPFCGSNDVRLCYMRGGTGEECCIDSEEELENTSIYAYIRCYGCDIEVLPNTYDTPKDVANAWNARGGVENEPLA